MLNIPTNKRLPTRLINPRDDGTHKPRPKPALVQTTAHQIRERLGADIPLFPQAVHVHFVAEELGDGADVCREPRQAQVGLRAVGEDFGEVVGDCQGLQAQAQVASYRDAVFAGHCYAGAAVWGRVSREVHVALGSGCARVLIEKGEDMVAFAQPALEKCRFISLFRVDGDVRSDVEKV